LSNSFSFQKHFIHQLLQLFSVRRIEPSHKLSEQFMNTFESISILVYFVWLCFVISGPVLSCPVISRRTIFAFDVIQVDLIWFDLIWFDLIGSDLIGSDRIGSHRIWS
jgi:hypothetical protein